jgi:hypothetical protein
VLQGSIPLDLLFDGWLGLLFALCARERVRADGPWSQPAISIVALFISMILAPCAIYFYLAHPAWSWLYVVNPARVPRIAVVTIVAAYGASVIGGYYGGAQLIRTARERIALYALGGGGAFLALLAFLLRHRLLRYASYDDFHANHSRSLGAVKLGYVLIAVVLGVIASTIFVTWELRRDGRRAAAR